MSPAVRPQGTGMHKAPVRPARRLLQTPWQWRRNDNGPGALAAYGLLMLVVLVLPAGAAMLWLPRAAALMAVGTLAGLAMWLLWASQFDALLRLDHPHAAHTVPGHARALRTTALGLWLAMVCTGGVATAGVVAMLGGDGLRTGLLVALGTGTALLVVACAQRWWQVWAVLSLAAVLSGVSAWRAMFAGTWAALQPAWQAQPWGLTLLMVALQGWCLCHLFGRGDARHARAYSQRDRMRKVMAASAAGQKPTLATYGRWGEWLGQPVQRLADGWLAHVCGHASARPASVLARADIVLHGAQHWVRQLSGVLLAQAVLAVAIAVTATLTAADMPLLLSRGQIGIAIGMASMGLGVVVSLPGALWMSRREQALLVLLPGMPQGAALNRALAWRQLRQCLWIWLALLPAMAWLVWVGQAQALAAFGLTVLPMVAWMWRDPSRMRAPQPVAVFLPMLLCMLAGLLAILLLRWQPGLLLPWALLMLSFSAGLLVWRWRRLAWRPQALPAGRLA